MVVAACARGGERQDGDAESGGGERRLGDQASLHSSVSSSSARTGGASTGAAMATVYPPVHQFQT